jgi:hypothetical protein
MDLYIKFISTLAFGLIGLGAVMKVLLETIFEDWDAFNDIAQHVMLTCSGKTPHMESIRAEDILLETEQRNSSGFSTRMVDSRRRRIQEINAVEVRLTKVGSPGPTTDLDILPS